MPFKGLFRIITVLFICLLAVVWKGFGQKQQIPEAQFGTVPDSLLVMDEYEPFPDAPYVYAYKELRISFEADDRSIIAHMRYHIRMKIFDADAREASIVAIPYYFDNEIEEVDEIDGYTYQPDGTQRKLSGDNIRTININSRYNVKEFTMPDVKNGSVIEYTYHKKRRYIEELPDFYLTHSAPTAVAKVSVQYPKYLRYSVNVTNYDGEVQKHIVSEDTSSVPKVFSIPQPDPLIKEIWLAYDIPPFEEKAYISSVDDYRGKLKFQLAEFGLPRQKLENSWELVVARIRKEQNPWDVIGDHDEARRIGARIGREFENLKSTQDSIYRYLNDRVNFNGSKVSYSELSDENVLDGEPADQAAINQTLLAMLTSAGIEAYPLMISTRQFGQINRSFPSYFQFNGQLVYTEIDGKSYYMDAGFAHSFPNLIPVDTYNESGLLLGKDLYRWIDIAPEKSLFSLQIKIDADLDQQGNLSGTLEARNYGYSAQLVRDKLSDGQLQSDIIRNAMFDGYAEVTLDSSRIKNIHNYEQPVVMETNFTIRRYATSFRDALDYRPMVVGYLMSNPFDEARRDLPVTLDAPEQLDLEYNISLPAGFVLQNGSSNQVIELAGAKLEEQYDVDGRQIKYEYHIDISRKRFESDLYPQLLDLYQRWVELSNLNWQLSRTSK